MYDVELSQYRPSMFVNLNEHGSLLIIQVDYFPVCLIDKEVNAF